MKIAELPGASPPGPTGGLTAPPSPQIVILSPPDDNTFRRRAWIIPKRCRPSGSQRSGADHMGSRLRIFQKRKQKIPHEMDVKKSDSNPGPHNQWSNALTTRLPTAAVESTENLLYLCTTLLTLIMYTVAYPKLTVFIFVYIYFNVSQTRITD